MNKSDLLPILAAFVIALLVIPFAAMPVNAATPTTKKGTDPQVVTIPEDDEKREKGIMVLGLTPTENTLTGATGWYTDSLCTTGKEATATVGPELDPLEPIDEDTTGFSVQTYYKKVSGVLCEKHTFAPVWATTGKNEEPGMDLLSQHKILATLDGVPTKPDYVFCEIVEKEKAKIPPPSTKTPSKRQFNDELIKTTMKDVTTNFICKFRWVKPGVGVLDVYFVGPRVKSFIADHMLIVTVGYKVGKTTLWASEIQDVCILGWSMAEETLQIKLFDNPGLSTVPEQVEYYWSWDDALGPFASCEEAAAWQLAWIHGGWPWAEN